MGRVRDREERERRFYLCRGYEPVLELFEYLHKAIHDDGLDTVYKIAEARHHLTDMNVDDYAADVAFTTRVEAHRKLSADISVIKGLAQGVVEAETGHRFNVDIPYYDRAAGELWDKTNPEESDV